MNSILDRLVPVTCVLALSGGAPLQGCTTFSSSKQSLEVKDIGGGTYSVGVSRSSSLVDQTKTHGGIDAAVAKAGDFCHAKGAKLADTHSVGNSITFKCAPSDGKPE